jgi:hypothetical protein
MISGGTHLTPALTRQLDEAKGVLDYVVNRLRELTWENSDVGPFEALHCNQTFWTPDPPPRKMSTSQGLLL